MTPSSPFPQRPFGRTKEMVSIIGLGGSHIGKADLSDQQSIGLMREALDLGINFLDNSWDYNKGRSERLMGRALRDGYRDNAFLMTKIDGRTSEAATRQIEESLRRLKVDTIDLLQHHEIIRYEDADRIFAKGGAQEAFEKAKKAGKIRYIGFTGHKDPNVHIYMLEVAARHGFRFDAVQMPLNVMDAHFRSFEQEVLPILNRLSIAVLGMKSMGYGIVLKSKTVTAVECLQYTLNLPITTLITGIESRKILKQAVDTAMNFEPLSKTAVKNILAKTVEAAADGRYELFKTSSVFDATAENPKWLGGHLPEAKRLSA